MPWQKLSNALYQRPIGDNEKFLSLLAAPSIPSGHELWGIFSVTSFRPVGSLATSETRQLEPLFRDAWKLLRFRHPSIASFESADTLNYVVPSSHSLDEWCNESFTTVTAGAAGPTTNDVIASQKPVKTMAIVFIPHLSQLILRSSHWRTDGIGFFMLLNAFLMLWPMSPAARRRFERSHGVKKWQG